MPRKVLIASTPVWSFCLAAERAFARSHAGAQVDVVDLFALLGPHSPHWRKTDVRIEWLNRKLQRFLLPVVTGDDVTRTVRLSEAAVPPAPLDPREVRPCSVGEARVGLGALSSVISLTTVSEAADTSEYGPAFAKAWTTAHLSAQIGEAMAARGYDEVYVFNGRSCVARPFCDVLERHARVIRFEQGATGNSVIEADTPIHHPATTASLVRSHDFDADAGAGFYEDRLRKAAGDPVLLFTAGQREGHLPEGLGESRFVAFFSASADEFAAISDDMGLGRFDSQQEAAVAMAEACRARGLGFVLRLHPHLQYKHPSWRREWDFARLQAEGARVLQPEDPCDSYALASAAHCVFTSGSTVGLECSYRGIPNADVGDWLGSRIGAMPAVRDAGELAAFIDHPSLPPGARDAALRYGSFVRRAGKPLPEYDVGSHPNFARIDGRIVDPVRYAWQLVRDGLRGRRAEAAGMMGGKAMVDASLEERAKAQGVSLRAPAAERESA